MSVNKADRNESKIQFEATYNAIVKDVASLVEKHFGAKDNYYTNNQKFLSIMESKIINVVSDIGTNIKMANSIYPIYQNELEERRKHQDFAIGLCYDLLNKYQVIMDLIYIPDDKYVTEIKNIIHEINALKKWRKSDNLKFRNLG